MKVPDHFEKAGLPGHDGVVWFRKTVELSAEQAKSKAILHLGQIDDMDVTWVNGKRVGGYENPGHHYTVRNYPIPTGLLKTGKNTIAVRVMDHGAPGGIAGKPEQLFFKLGKDTVSLANLWHFAPGANLNALNKHAALADHPLLRPLAKPTAPIPEFANGFTLKGNQSIVIVGGANAAECQRYGYLETLLASANPGQQLHVRNMAWAADTIYTQQRPRNFFATNNPSYGEKDRRPAMAADVLFVWFGQMESLEGTARLDDFTKAYTEILTQFAGYTGRLVLVTPVPCEDPLDLGLKVKGRNAALAKYASAIRQIARDRKLSLVDLFTALRGKAVTSDGFLLSGKGHQLAAQAFANQLGFSPKLPANIEPLRQAILKKNALWQQYWFPPNWAFLYGNRQQTASSRSHLNGSYRWFPEEIQSILPELKQLENAITKEAARARQ
ncbi:beta galactosidase jelly roll domain-containing protein, partial [Verrucomicrobia bacterium]|nr:beta galactosidase jelly roll domain-containing protein [Verrucomicrobiota bacterium]